MDTQQPIFKDQNFTITRELFISGNARYAIQHLCSIKLIRTRRTIPYTLLFLELLLMVGGFGWNYKFHSLVALLGILGFVANALVYSLVKPVHKLWLVFSSGEKEMIGVTDYDYLEGLANAFSRSIVETRQQRNLMIS
ncbi:hypothetical protein D7Z26_04415 [Cohnella endophytica]|uniref:Uncharacterized protein n=1 Tax=Cohnella endophytica TaxID=2419778 RepID=A0A494Y974_9BACL|nr:DUF6232 family protein [Cohnella endophytica]RKP57233.1 hypothetical protein D7Z26_04415 [Cohnella endophytica]